MSGTMNVMTWNIQNKNADAWPLRRISLKAVLDNATPEVLGVQEAWIEQVTHLRKVLPGHDYAGVGRDDGKRQGEQCGIFYDGRRLDLLETSTFWLSDTPDRPSVTWGHEHVRICTWCRLRDTEREQRFFVFNTHLPLVADGRAKAARLIVEQIGNVACGEPTLLLGDFNSMPGSVPWSVIQNAGFVSAETAAGGTAHSPTHHRRGVPGACIDAIFVTGEWRVSDFRVITGKGVEVYPSDHFPVEAKVTR